MIKPPLYRFAVPLNDDAVILRKQLFKHSEFVFTYKGKPIKQ